MKKFYVLMLLCLFIMIAPVSCYASVKVAQALGPAAISGSNLYYVKKGTSGGIYKYNIKTKKNQLIKTGYFSQISLKGDYIYYVFAANYIDADCNTYYAIYRMKKDGTKEKRLAYGDSPVIIGKWIYYIEHKYSSPETVSTGYVSKMKLDGSSKKKVKKVNATALYKYGNKVLYSKSVTNDGGRSNVDTYLYTMKGKKSSYKNKIRRYINCSREQYTYNGYTSVNTHYLRVGNYVYYGKRTNLGNNNNACVYHVYRKKPKGGKEKLIYNSGSNTINHLFALSKYIYLETNSSIILLDANCKVVAELNI